MSDSMDFEQPIAPDFDADDIDIFAELGAPLLTQSTTPSPPQNILLEDDEPMSVDPQLVAELLQVLAQHSIRQHSDEGINVLPESAQNVDLNSARVTLIDDEYRLSLLVELQDNQQIRPCVRAHRNSGELDFVTEQNIPSVWRPLYNLLENAFKQAIQSLKASAYLS
ncbi:MAG TPA: hypothetical protein HA266_02870 [Candidatus Poseidoniaceae archaeon]|nr:hypothetical protein [Candidatus Poseidoniaceae archaeon]